MDEDEDEDEEEKERFLSPVDDAGAIGSSSSKSGMTSLEAS